MATDLAPAPPIMPSLPPTQLTPSKKRNHEGEIINHSSFTPLAGQQSSPLSAGQSPPGSPQFSDQSTPLTDLGATPSVSPSKPSDMAPADGKKRKLTFAEREAEKAIKQAEKEEKERLKAEARAKKEEEKAKKEEERAKKEEERAKRDEEKKRKEEEKESLRKEREEKKKQKDAEKQAKEAEKQRKEAEALKKERAQMRIGTFFIKPPVASTPTAVSDCDDVSRGTTPSRRSSVGSIDMEPPLSEAKPSPTKPVNSEYSKWVFPFYVYEHVELAPLNRFCSTSTSLGEEMILNQDGILDKINVRFHKRRRNRHIEPVKKILSEISRSENVDIDLMNSTGPLANVPYKYFFYREDVRPAYQGTYTKAVSPRQARKLAVKPSYRGLPDTDYDYDSEAEWQEPEEGDEEVLDDDEKSEDEDGDEDMDDFLDDEGDLVKRQLIVGNMEPKSSGLCWEDQATRLQDGSDLSLYRMDVLHDSTKFPIDPYSTFHWSDIGKKTPIKREDKPQQSVPMQPPRLPLMAVDPNGGYLTPSTNLFNYTSSNGQSENNVSMTKAKGKASSSGKPLKLVPTEFFPAFKAAVSGSTLTKLGLVEVLKAQFPKCSKDAIKHTLEEIAERRGAKESEKRWVLLDPN